MEEMEGKRQKKKGKKTVRTRNVRLRTEGTTRERVSE